MFICFPDKISVILIPNLIHLLASMTDLYSIISDKIKYRSKYGEIPFIYMHMYDNVVWIWRATATYWITLCIWVFLSLKVVYQLASIFSGKIISTSASIFQYGGKIIQNGGHFEFNIAYSFFTLLSITLHKNILLPSSWCQTAANKIPPLLITIIWP